MIKYNLRCNSNLCANKEPFDGWFENMKAYEDQKRIGLLSCPYCGGGNVVKNLMSPSIKSSKKINSTIENEQDNERGSSQNEVGKKPVSESPVNDAIAVLRSIRKEIEKNAEYVGKRFVKEARAIHSGKAKERPIYGHADSNKIEELKDEGINISSIPWVQDDH